MIHPKVIEEVSEDFKILYTPFHGTGRKPIFRILNEVGFKNIYTVEAQLVEDPEFRTLKSPNPEEVEAFDKKKDYIESLKDFEMTGDHKTDLDAIKLHIETWKNFGKVPFARRHIEGKFNKILDALFEKLNLSKKDTEMMRFANRMDHLTESHDTRKLDNEKIFIMRKIDEVQHEIFQLENNIQFFTNTKNAKKENSIVLEVRKNIAIHKETLAVWKEKLKQLRSLNIE